MTKLSLALTLALSLGLGACANRPCRDLKNPELAAQQTGGSREEDSSSNTSASTGAAKGAIMPPTPGGKPASPPAGGGTVLVSKPDGSLQCGMGKAISPEDMEKQLAGIKVISREKRPDGLMHVQVCGSPTGMLNVYEIPATSLKDAEAKGFKKFEPKG